MVDPELWLFETVAVRRMPLWSLVHPDMISLHNKPGHGLARSRLMELLERLLWEGDLFVEDQAGRSGLFTAAELDTMTSRDANSPCYGLTPKGGARWEQLAQVRWDRYVDDHYLEERGGTNGWELISTNESLLREFVAVFFPAMHVDFIPGSEQWDSLEPWEATYWKTLPKGYRVRCQVAEKPTDWSDATFQRLRRLNGIVEDLTRWHIRSSDPG